MTFKTLLSQLLLSFSLLTFSSHFVSYASETSSDDELDYSYLNNFQEIKDMEIEHDWIDIQSNKAEIPNTNDTGLKIKAAFKTAGKIGFGIVYQVGKLVGKHMVEELIKPIAATALIVDQGIKAGEGIHNMYKSELRDLKKDQ